MTNYDKYTLQNLYNHGLIINYRTPKVPLYVAAYDVVLGLIRKGELKPGEKLPSENELADFLGVARSTIRMAVLVLQEDGYVTTQQGKGTFVSEKSGTFSDRQKAYGIFVKDVVLAEGKEYSCSYRRFSIVPHEDFLNEKLGVKQDDKIGMFIKVHTADGVPAVMSQEFFIVSAEMKDKKIKIEEAEVLFENWVRREFDQVMTSFMPTLPKNNRKSMLNVTSSTLLLVISHDIFSKGREIVFAKHYYNTNILNYSVITSK